MTILDKLHYIEEHKCIYDIHYCRAGVGFIFFEESKIKNPTFRERKIGVKKYREVTPANWREGLTVDTYYSTFEDAVKAEHQRM